MRDDDYPKNSFYNWQSFPEKTMKIRHKLAIQILLDFIQLQDFFFEMNGFVNHKSGNKTNNIPIEERLTGINKLFTLGMIENPDHKAKLEELSYKIAFETRGKGLTDKERAERIAEDWKEKILELR